MKRRSRTAFRPLLSEVLEDRVVLNGTVPRQPSVLVGGLTPGLQTLGHKPAQPVIALTNKAFDAFVSDYTQARAAYLAALPTTTTDPTYKAFKGYTVNRVNLLAQQVISNVMTTTAGLSKNGNRYVLPSMIARKINGLAPPATSGGTVKPDEFLVGTMGQALVDAIPQPGSNPQAASINALAQDQAIETARVSVINGLNVLRNGDFGVKHKHH